MKIKPLLAPNKEPDWSVVNNGFYYSSIKMDGIRCLVLPNGELQTRSGKGIPNIFLKERLDFICLICKSKKLMIDGEIWSPNYSFQEIVSDVMSLEKPLDYSPISFWSFDCLNIDIADEKYIDRLARLNSVYTNEKHWKIIAQSPVKNESHLQSKFRAALSEGHEGLIVRNKYGLYKHGRATIKEANIFKYKPVYEMDAQVIDIMPMSITNEGGKSHDEFGYLKTSTKKEYKSSVNMLGAFLVQLEDGRQLRIGSGDGLTDELRSKYWEQKDHIMGKWLTFKYLPVNEKDLPRMPIFLRFREDK